MIDHENTNHGVVSIDRAREIAEEAGLDLVEVSPQAEPPVARVMDYGKFAYERARKERQARKQQKQIETKTIRIRPKTAQFHRDIHVRRGRKWLEEGKKVKVLLRFRWRERDYPEIARNIMREIAEDLQDISTIEQQPTMDGRSMVMMLTPETK